MGKDTFYFSHDYNTRTDIKIKKLVAKHNYLGYGLFWAIVEDLYNNANALPTDYESIAFELHSNKEVIESIINDFGLFLVEDGFFKSSSIQNRLEQRNYKSKIAQNNAFSRWNKTKNATALHPQSESNAIKESKIKESKVKENIDIPNESIFLEFCKEQLGDLYLSYEFSLKSKYSSWVDAKWKDGYGKPIKNWKSKIKNTIPHLRTMQIQEKKQFYDSNNKNEPQKEYWEIHYGHLAKTKEEFMQLVSDGKIEY